MSLGSSSSSAQQVPHREELYGLAREYGTAQGPRGRTASSEDGQRAFPGRLQESPVLYLVLTKLHQASFIPGLSTDLGQARPLGFVKPFRSSVRLAARASALPPSTAHLTISILQVKSLPRCSIFCLNSFSPCTPHVPPETFTTLLVFNKKTSMWR